MTRFLYCLLLLLAIASNLAAVGSLQAEIIVTEPICKEAGRYIGWPSVAQAANGDLIAVFSGNRTAHVSPDGVTQMVRSSDGGITWSGPITIQDLPIDDRDAGIVLTDEGTLLVSWFTGPPYGTELEGSYVIRSEDDGATWGEPIGVPVSAPHGAIQLSDGRLLYMGQSPHCSQAIPPNYNGPPSGSPYTVSVVESLDDGVTWGHVSDFPVPETELMLSFDEPHIVEASPGNVVALFRDCNAPGRIWQSNSSDGGVTWSAPYRTPMQGHPPHVIRLDNGWLLNVYAKRSGDLGQYACISRNGGLTWEIENEIKLASATDGDMGYPASTQLPDGSIWTVYYQRDGTDALPCLMGTHWRLDGLIPETPPSGFVLRHEGATDPADEDFTLDGEAGSPVTDDLGRPAWHIDGGFSRYLAAFQYPQVAKMKAEGWRAAMEVHDLLKNDDATDWGVHLEVSDDSSTYLILIGSDAAGDPTLYRLAAIDGYLMEPIPLEGIAGDGYHRYEMVFDPEKPGTVDVLVDGLFQATVEGADNTAHTAWASRTVFGSTDGGAVSSANYALVELVIGEDLIPGDLDGDGIVGSADLDIIRAAWGATVFPGDRSAGDPSGDGTVGSDDLDIVRANWGAGRTTAVPEPGVPILLFSLFVGASLLRRRIKGVGSLSFSRTGGRRSWTFLLYP